MPQTKDEIRASYPDKTNPRWIACHIALGHLPETWEFIIWLSEKWVEFAKLACNRGCRNATDLCEAHDADLVHAMFDEWLYGGSVEILPIFKGKGKT